jgi:uncharacterized membrane protein
MCVNDARLSINKVKKHLQLKTTEMKTDFEVFYFQELNKFQFFDCDDADVTQLSFSYQHQ